MSTATSAPDRLFSRDVSVLMLAGVAYFTVAGLSFPVLPRLVERELGGGDSEIGMAFGVFALGMLVTRPLVGYLADRVGRRPLMVVGALGVALMQLLVVPSAGLGLVAFLMVRFVTGMASSAMYIGQATTATELGPENRSGEVFATFSVAVFVGFAVGPVVGEWVLQAHGFTAAFGVAAGVGAACALLGAVLPETRPDDVVARFDGLRSLFHPVAARAGTVSFLVFLTFIAFNAFITPYAESLGLTQARWILLTYSTTTLVVRAVGGRLIDRANRVVLGTTAHLVVALGLVVMVGLNTEWALYVGGAIMAAGLAFNVPLMVVIAAESARPNERSRVVATVVVFGDLANSGGAFLLGYVAEGVGYRGMYLVAAAMALSAAALFNSRFMAPVTGLRRQVVP